MPVIKASEAPKSQSASVSSNIRSIGGSYKAVPLHSRTYRIGSGRVITGVEKSLNKKIGDKQIDIEAILSNNASKRESIITNTDNFTNLSVPLKDQPTPLIFADFSKETRVKILDIILSSKMESQVDRLLLRKMLELIEKDPIGARLLNASVESIKKELTSSNETLDALRTFYDAYLRCNTAFTLEATSKNAALIFENNISSLNVGNTLNLLRENYNPSDFISIVSALTSYEPAKLQNQGLHAVFWLGLRDAYDSVKFGLSPGFLIEQNRRDNASNSEQSRRSNTNSNIIKSSVNEIKRKYVGIKSVDEEIGLANFNIDTLNDPRNYSFNRIPYPAGMPAIDKVLYYCGLISSELTVSVGMGITDGTPEGQKFGSLSDPIAVSLGAPSEGPDRLGSPNSVFSTAVIDSNGRFANSNSDEKIYMYKSGNGNQENSSKQRYIDDILKNPLSNRASVYETALNNSDNLIQEVEKFLSNVMQNGNSKKSLTTKSGLFSRIIADFGLMLENLGKGNGNPSSIAIHFAMMRKLEGDANNIAAKKELKLLNQRLLATKLKASLPENYENDLITQSKTIKINHIVPNADFYLNSNFSNITINNYIAVLKNKFSYIKDVEVSDDYYGLASVSEPKIIFTILNPLIQNSSESNDSIYDVVVQIVKDIENECNGLISDFKPQGSFLRSNGTTRYSGFDSLTIANLIYECFAVLASIFADVKLTQNFRNILVSVSGYSFNDVVGRTEKAGRFLSTLAAAIGNKNTDFLINPTGVITTDNITSARERLSIGTTPEITPNSLKEAADRILSEDDVLWNLFSVSKSIFKNVKNSSAKMLRYGNLLSSNTSNLGKIEKAEQRLIDFVNDASLNPVDFLSSMNTVSLNRAKLRLRELESLQKPYDLAELPDQIYEACKLFLESKNSYVKGKIIAFGLAKDQFSDDFDSEDNLNRTLQAKIARNSDFEPHIEYKDLLMPRISLRYVATEEEVVKAITNLSANDDYSYSLESLALETKYYDMKTGDYVNITTLTDALPIMESYLASKLLEICFDVSLEPHVFNSGGMEWNPQALRSIISVASSILQVEGLFDYMFRDNQDGTFSPRYAEQVNSKISQETIRYDSEGVEYYEDLKLDSATMSLIHSLLDTLYFKTGLIKKMVFARDVFDGIYVVNFDQNSMRLIRSSENRKLLADFVDTYYISGDIS